MRGSIRLGSNWRDSVGLTYEPGPRIKKARASDLVGIGNLGVKKWKLPGTYTRNLLFTGKGGVGKTSIACATAITLADQGKRVLLVSTDPASNLDEVLLTPLGIRPSPIESVPGLFAMNVDPVQAAREYRERVVGPYRELLPEAAVNSIEEQLSGACTVEIAAFDEFAKLLGDSGVAAEFDHVIFDTAPTGHRFPALAAASGVVWLPFKPMSAVRPVSVRWLACRHSRRSTGTL